MLGELSSWRAFLEVDSTDLASLPRRQLRSGHADIRNRLSREITTFCSRNFCGMDVPKLSRMYEEIKASRGLELPLSEFEKRFVPVRPQVLRRNPARLTICVSLWGMQLKFPEDELANDIIEGLRLASNAQAELRKYEGLSHSELKSERADIASLIRQKSFAARSTVVGCFDLMDAYLNGLAWDYLQTHGTADVSNRQRKLLDDSSSASIRDKLLKYPEIITGRTLWRQPDPDVDSFLDIVKPFRDSLVHPSPFSAPERFGGYNKLRLFYRIDQDTAQLTAHLLIMLVKRIHGHVHAGQEANPEWVEKLAAHVQELPEEQQR
jgi:hypothetical protein